MIKRKKLLITVRLIILVVGLISIIFILKSRPKRVIENKLGIKLPAESEIINFDSYSNGYFNAKIIIRNHDINYIKSELDNFFEGVVQKIEPEEFPFFSNTCSWWDLDVQNIETCYSRFISGEKRLFRPTLKSREVWAFITKGDGDDEYYLYISY